MIRADGEEHGDGRVGQARQQRHRQGNWDDKDSKDASSTLYRVQMQGLSKIPKTRDEFR